MEQLTLSSSSGSNGNSPTSSISTLSTDQFQTLIDTTKETISNSRSAIAAHASTVSSPAMAPYSSSSVHFTKAATLDSARVTIPKLTISNFHAWESAATHAITHAGLWKYLDPGVVPPSTTNEREYDTYIQESSSVWTALVSSLDDDTRYHCSEGTSTPRELWVNICRHFQISGERQLMALNLEFLNLKMPEDGDVLVHLGEFQRLRRLLEGTNYRISDHFAMRILYNSLPDSYSTWSILQRSQGSAVTLDVLCTNLKSEYRLTRRGDPVTGVSAFPITTKVPKSASKSGPCTLPADLLPFSTPGRNPEGPNPALADRARDTCRHCLGMGHQANQQACSQYHVRKQLWGTNQGQGRGPKRPNGKISQANVAKVSTAQPTVPATRTSTTTTSPTISTPSASVASVSSWR